MIFGKTKAHKQAKLKYLHENRISRFAWRPVRLKDGRWVWLQEVWVKYPTEHFMGVYYNHSHRYPNEYYLTETNN